jgi:exoribonuclease-2
LSTDLTSLNPDVDRLAVVVEIAVGDEGTCGESSVYRALVHNHSKLAYHATGAWLEGDGPMPPAIAAVPGLAENLKLQDQVAQRLKAHRHDHGALELETIEARAEFDGDTVGRLSAEAPNRARTLIEDFMIAANGIIARFLEARRFPVLRRVVRSPERWQKITALAADFGERLPGDPDAGALNAFLMKRRAADALRFPDLSLTIVKLLGRGEYLASFPGQSVVGHFGLAVSEYTHSTAPNRRYPDLITQRLVRAALAAEAVPYRRDELGTLATECTQKEDGAQKVERLVRKAAAACLLSSRIGQEFDGVVTGASAKGTWVRVFDPPVEGRVERGQEGLDVGDKVRVRLVHTNPERGFIDFVRA